MCAHAWLAAVIELFVYSRMRREIFPSNFDIFN
jgi:hypothetical protein